jgi:hypothetical protein
LIQLKGFINIVPTRDVDQPKSWIIDDQVGMPMVLLTKGKKNNLGILVIPTSAASNLATAGVGCATKETSMMFAPDLYATMAKESVRWIVVPCSDGMSSAHEAPDALEKDKYQQPNSNRGK